MKQLLCIAALIAAGCASTPPARYLTLDMTPSETAHDGGFQIVRIELSDALRRPELLAEAGPTEIEYYSNALWVSNLGELVEEKLIAELGAGGDPLDQTQLAIMVWNFGEDDTGDPRCGHVKMSVSAWPAGFSIREEPAWTDVFETCNPIAGDDVTDIANALSEGLEEIAREIVDAERNSAP
jgi:uncharacterized lipoprotein YmbA